MPPLLKSDDTTSLHVRVDDGSHFAVHVANWPEGADPQHPETVFGDYWPPMGVTVSEPSQDRPDREFSVTLGNPDSLARFESDFGLYVSEKLAGFVAVHAALLAKGNHVIVVPGSSGAGKSTLCVAAMERGWEVWSDEYCLIDTQTGQVRGWPRPIRERLTGGGLRRVPHQGPNGPGNVTHVIVMRYSGDANGPDLSLDEISPGQVAMDLMANTVCARSRAEETFRATTALARTVQGLAGLRGPIGRSLPALEGMLG
jgi:hypothetical protein